MPRQPLLKEVSLPDYGPPPGVPAPPTADKLLHRIAAARLRMEQQKLTHLVVYADREHTANLAWLTNFDARFEEALLVLSLDRDPLLITGNECAGYLGISALHIGGRLRHELFQDFSLLDQPRNRSRPLKDILADEGIGPASRVGAIGWKYYAASNLLDIPSWIADLLRDLAGRENVVNATDIFMHAGYGLRSVVTAEDVALFEFANWHASEGMKRLILGLEEGMTDFEAVSLAGVNGLPLGCHITLATGTHRDLGLSGPAGQKIARGSPLSVNLCYWRANVCRAGWVAESAWDLPPEAQDYVETFAGPYVAALAEWFALMHAGTEGGRIQALIDDLLPHDLFGVTLNPGHLIDIDEWVSSPIFPGSKLPLRSGMMIQVDIIPFSSVYGSTRMEDGILIADGSLRGELKTLSPAVYGRCMARRSFMENVIGIPLPDDVLPLSNLAGVVQPFLLAPEQVIALDG
jgi:Xaa-Pro aminopeptidase